MRQSWGSFKGMNSLMGTLLHQLAASVVLLLGCSHIMGCSPPGDPTLYNDLGFRGAVIGMKLADIEGLTRAVDLDHGLLTAYKKSNDPKKIGTAAVEQIVYTFTDNELSNIKLSFESSKACDAMFELFKAQYKESKVVDESRISKQAEAEAYSANILFTQVMDGCSVSFGALMSTDLGRRSFDRMHGK